MWRYTVRPGDTLIGLGQRYLRDPAQWPQEYGVMKLETVPKGIVRQHLMPFQGGRRFDDYVD